MKERFDFNNIRDFVGEDNQTVKEMVDIFLETVPESLQLINESFQSKDYRKLNYAAHKLKSSLDLLNIEELRTEIREIENSADQLESIDELPPKIEHLNKVLTELLPQIQEESRKLV